MARRVPPGEKPYRPVDDALVHSVLKHAPRPAGSPPTPAVVKEGSASSGPVPLPLAPEPAAPDGQSLAATLEKLCREKRLLLTPSEEREVERLVSDMAQHLNTPVKASHVLRATVTLLRHAGDELLRQSRRVGPVKRPPNNDALALANFEHLLARLIEVAVRNTRPLE